MPDIGLDQTESPNPLNETEPGELRLGIAEPSTVVTPIQKAELEAKIPDPPRGQYRAGTVEHLAARRSAPPVDAEAPEVKERLSALRSETTALVTGLRWGGVSVQNTAERIIPLLNIGPFQQWAPVLVPSILEIDRAGNLVPVWLNVIEQEDPGDLPSNANPAETMVGRARRLAILMLGNYKSPELSQLLGKLATDPNTSLYATQSLVKQGTTTALHALISAFKEATGWAKVDVIEACLTLNQPRFHEILLAGGIDRAPGLESYIAVPIFRSISLERYLQAGSTIPPHLSEQAALIFSQVLQDSMRMNAGAGTLPIVFERDVPPLATALFAGARSAPTWQNVLAVHRLGLLLGHYWADMTRGTLQNPRIAEQVHSCLSLMPEIERWMNGPGRDVLLEALTSSDEEAFTPIVKVISDLRDPRAISVLVSRLDATTGLTNREQATRIALTCDTLGRLGDRRVGLPMLQLIERSINTVLRSTRPKRRENLVAGDADIPGSIVYAAVIRAFGLLNDPTMLDFILNAAHDFDPYVRLESLEALKHLDPTGDDMRSRMIAREALNDARNDVVRSACQLIVQYRDRDALPSLQQIPQTRPELASYAYNALQQLAQ